MFPFNTPYKHQKTNAFWCSQGVWNGKVGQKWLKTERWKSLFVNICDSVFKNRPSKICGRQSLENLRWYSLLRQTICHLTFFKGCLSQILLCLFLNTLTHFWELECIKPFVYRYSAEYLLCKFQVFLRKTNVTEFAFSKCAHLHPMTYNKSKLHHGY